LLRSKSHKAGFDSFKGVYKLTGMHIVLSCWKRTILCLAFSQLGFALTHRLHADSTHFFPIGMYGVHHPEDLLLVHEAGFNSVIGSADQTFLDTAHELGIKVIASPGSSSGPSFNVNATREKVKSLDHHPALLSWYLVDEPDMQRIPPWKVEMDQRLLKSIPAQKPVSLVLFHGMHVKDYGDLPDILMLDNYPVPWMPLAHFAQHLYWARTSISTPKPIYGVLQAFDWHYFKQVLPGEKNLRKPTTEEIRCMTFMSLAQGMNGLFYYTYRSGEWDIREHPELWEGLKQVIGSVNDNPYLLNAQRKWWLPRYEIDPHEQRRSATLEPSISMTMLEDADGLNHLLLINTTPNKLALTVKLPDSSNKWAPVFEGKAPFGGLQPNVTYKFAFEPYQVRLLKGYEIPNWSNWLE